MKKYLLSISLFFLLGTSFLFAQSSPYSSPKGKYSLRPQPNTSAGTSSLAEKETLGCTELLASNKVYPTGQVYAFCNEAEVACLRKGLLENAIKGTSDPDALKILQDQYEFSLAETNMKLAGCRYSIIEGSTGQSFLQKQQEKAQKEMRSKGSAPSARGYINQ